MFNWFKNLFKSKSENRGEFQLVTDMVIIQGKPVYLLDIFFNGKRIEQEKFATEHERNHFIQAVIDKSYAETK